jgi:hypothetical protein
LEGGERTEWIKGGWKGGRERNEGRVVGERLLR